MSMHKLKGGGDHASNQVNFCNDFWTYNDKYIYAWDSRGR